MQALVLDKQGLHYEKDYPQMEPQLGEALIRVLYAGVCNTDLEMIRGYKGFSGILGHEFVGIVERCQDKALVGQRVVGEINIGCGVCKSCLSGCANHCTQRNVLGIIGKNGVFADYTVLPEKNLHIVSEAISDLTAVFAEPLAAAVEIVEQCHVKPTDRVAVIGDGKLGQLIAQVLSLTGCCLTVIGKHPEKLSLLKDRARTVIFNPTEDERRFDMVVECTGNEEGLQYAGAIVKPRGKVILKSTFANQKGLIGSEWVVNEIMLIGSRCGPIAAALRLMERGLVDVEPLIDEIYTLPQWEKVFSKQGSLKAVFKL
ncbi:MAG: alcohol dehydrogenase catalytic domain-containing protein [Negativicutes bacterium]|nr:alcohol dehydrogenase catalytic domain-containing protein [Negativicutes bacterium]